MIFLVLIGLTGTSFALTDNLFYGTSSFERLPSSIIPNNSQTLEIKFQYQNGPYSLTDLKPTIDVSPKEAIPFVHIEFEPVDGIDRNSVSRIYGIITVDPEIPREKIFLIVSYAGTDLNGVLFQSGWNDSVIIDIAKSDTIPDEPLMPEPSPICPAGTMVQNDVCVIANTDCGEEATYQDGICVVDETEEKPVDPSNLWRGPTWNPNVESPLKQFKSGIMIDEIQCKDSLSLVTKNDGSPAYITLQTKTKLMERGWAELSGSIIKQRTEHAGPEFGLVPLDIASIEDGHIRLYPVGTCAGIDIDRLTLDELNQRYPATYTTKSGKTYEIKFLSINDNDLKEMPVISELIRATHQIPFPLNDGISASKGLVENPDWNNYREWYDQKRLNSLI